MDDVAQELQFIVEEEKNGIRLDQFLAGKLPDVSRSFLQKKIKGGKVSVDGKAVKAGW